MRYCKKCGAILKKGHSFCGRCGRKHDIQLKQHSPVNSQLTGKRSLILTKSEGRWSTTAQKKSPSSVVKPESISSPTESKVESSLPPLEVFPEQPTPVSQSSAKQSATISQSSTKEPIAGSKSQPVESSSECQFLPEQVLPVRQPLPTQSSLESLSLESKDVEPPKKESPSKESSSKESPSKESPKKKPQIRIVLVVAMACLLLVLLVISIFMRISNSNEAEGEVLSGNVDIEINEARAEEERAEESTEEPEESIGPEELEEENGELYAEVPETVVLEEVLGKWLWVLEDRNEEDFAFNLMTYYFGDDGSGERSINGQSDVFTWGVTAEGILIFIWPGNYVEKWDFTIQGDELHLESKQNAGMGFIYQRIAIEGQEELIGRWGWNTNHDWYYLFEMDGLGSRTDSNLQGRDEFVWFLLTDGGLIVRIGEESAELWDYEINDNMLTLASRQERGIVFHYIKLD